MAKFNFDFEELPLLIDGGFEAGLVNGRAEITYTKDVWDFVVTGLWLDGHKENVHTEEQKLLAKMMDKPLPRFTEKPVNVEAGSWLDTTITGRLYEGWSSKVHDAIREAIAEDRIEAAEYRAEQRRDDRMMAGL